MSFSVNGDILSALLGLSSAVIWGAGDFCGGISTRSTPLLWVLAIGNTAGLICLIVLALITEGKFPDTQCVLWAAASGCSGALGLSMLYRGLSRGHAAMVAPVSAVISALVPVSAGVMIYGAPGPSKLAGFALAIAGIWLVSKSDPLRGKNGFGCALLAGLGFGFFLVTMGKASAGGSVFWPIAVARITSLSIYVVFLAKNRPPLALSGKMLAVIIMSGLFDTLGNALFAASSSIGRLDIASILSSMYPASTVILSVLVLGERMRFFQLAGFIIILGAIALIV